MWWMVVTIALTFAALFVVLRLATEAHAQRPIITGGKGGGINGGEPDHTLHGIGAAWLPPGSSICKFESDHAAWSSLYDQVDDGIAAAFSASGEFAGFAD
jgi:hypothetical protein